MNEDNYANIINTCNKELQKRISKKQLWDEDETVAQIYEILYTAYWQQIHKVLAPAENYYSEKEIRSHIRYIIANHLQPLYAKIGKFNKLAKKDRKYSALLNKYMSLYDNFFALAAFRSIKHFALYIEFDKDPKDRVWENVMPCFEGLFYYENRMILDGAVKKICKRYPTGYGKSYSDIITISWIFGIDYKNSDIVKVVGNPSLVSDVLVGITNIMKSARYAKVFPYYSQFGCSDDIYSICRIQQGLLVINGSLRPKSFLCCSKETSIDGGRFKYRFYDDICRAKDKDNINEHDKDWLRYNDTWKKREYDKNFSFEIAGGTAYSIYDFLSRYMEASGIKKAVPDKRFKFTEINEDTKFVSIACPKLDPVTDESTYPSRYSTEDARAERDRDLRTFMAMEQQSPLPPEGTPYYWDNLKLYSELPLKDTEGGSRSNMSYAALDLPRKGNNYAALGIFYRDNNTNEFYLTDCVYEKKPLDAKIGNEELLDIICQKLVFHRTTNLVVETNTNSMIASEIKKRLDALNWTCNILPVYSYENKEARIFETQSCILERIRFPERKMYAESSPMGQMMRHIVCYAYDGKNDDGIDMVSMFAKAYINLSVKMGSIKIIEKRR